MAQTCAGVILAGGRGERFGGPKAFAKLPDGRTFLIACRDLLARGGATPIVATLPPGTVVAAEPAFQPFALPEDGLAMFDSLRLGLARALDSAGWRVAVVLPVDHPLVAPATVAAIVTSCSTAALPLHGGKHGHPIALAREVAERIVSRILPGPTLREVLRAAGTVAVPVSDPAIHANCNTPEALAAALALVTEYRPTR